MDKASGNVLTVKFKSPVAYAARRFDQLAVNYPILPEALVPEYQGENHANHIRKMQSSFSWGIDPTMALNNYYCPFNKTPFSYLDWGPAFPTMGLWHPVKVEAYDSVIIRDWWVNTQRDEAQRQWRLDMKLHCETQDSNTNHRGVFTVVIYHPDTGKVIYRLLESAVIAGDDKREATHRLVNTIVIDFSEVRRRHHI